MATNAFIKLVPESAKEQITIEETKELFHYYKEITKKTGEQVNWTYSNVAFPYELKETEEGKDKWFYLSSPNERYHAMIVSVGSELHKYNDKEERVQNYVQITLPPSATHGDKGKANEFAKFIAKKLQGELHLFNGRIMYFYPRK